MNRRSNMKKLLAVLLMVGSTVAIADDSYTGEILGGVAGGIIGNQIGGGSGRVVTTAIGAGIGAIVGGRIEDDMNYNRSYNRYERREVIYRQPPTVYYGGYHQIEPLYRYIIVHEVACDCDKRVLVRVN
jgi:uncharacterized protein YcfJ